jgi:hypothetical protein
MAIVAERESGIKRHKCEKVPGPWIAFPASLASSNAWVALSPAALQIFGVVCAIHAKTWKPNSDGRFDLSYAEISASTAVKDRDRIGPALRELVAAGIIERLLKGYGGPARSRSASQYRVTFLGSGPHVFEVGRTVEEWRRCFAGRERIRTPPTAISRRQELRGTSSDDRKKFSRVGRDGYSPVGPDATPGSQSRGAGQNPLPLSPVGRDAYLSISRILDGGFVAARPTPVADPPRPDDAPGAAVSTPLAAADRGGIAQAPAHCSFELDLKTDAANPDNWLRCVAAHPSTVQAVA